MYSTALARGLMIHIYVPTESSEWRGSGYRTGSWKDVLRRLGSKTATNAHCEVHCCSIAESRLGRRLIHSRNRRTTISSRTLYNITRLLFSCFRPNGKEVESQNYLPLQRVSIKSTKGSDRVSRVFAMQSIRTTRPDADSKNRQTLRARVK